MLDVCSSEGFYGQQRQVPANAEGSLRDPAIWVANAALKYSEMKKTATRAAIPVAARPSDPLELPSTPE
jgi:hypothetical protein